jgi:uncharacterized Ntn-hydrolase superfamily protein
MRLVDTMMAAKGAGQNAGGPRRAHPASASTARRRSGRGSER